MHARSRLARHLAVPLFAMAVVAVGFNPIPARAQAAAPVSTVDARVTADAARCVKIDQEIAQLTAQLRSGAITAADRTARAAELTAERRRITSAYGSQSPSARAFQAEFNRLRAADRADAREQAVAEAQQKREAAAADLKAKRDAAAAEAQAKRDAAARDAQARRDAAAAAELEKTKQAEAAAAAFEADVEHVAEERLQRGRDKFFQDFGLPAPTSPAIVAQQSAAADAIRLRHVPSAAAPRTSAFDQRVEAAVQRLLADRKKEWFGDVFPSPAMVTSQVSGDTEKTAALELATRRLAQHTPEPRPPSAQAKLEAYQAARRDLQADFSHVIRLTQDASFEAKVFATSLPAYAAELRQRVAREQLGAAADAQRRRANQLTNFGVLAVLIVGAWLPIRMMRRQKFRWKRQSRQDWEALVANSPLPKQLHWIDVPGFRYPVALFSGLITNKEVWTETTITTETTHHQGPNYGFGHTNYSTTRTYSSSTVYHRYWLTTTEGVPTWHKFSDNEFVADIGQKISSIWSDNYWVAIGYNHAMGQMVFPAWWTKAMHRPPYWRIVGITALACLALASAATFLFTQVLGVSPEALAGERGNPSHAIQALLFVLVPTLVVYVGVAGAIFTARRQRHFRKQVVPRYEAFFRTYDPVIPEVAKA